MTSCRISRLACSIFRPAQYQLSNASFPAFMAACSASKFARPGLIKSMYHCSPVVLSDSSWGDMDVDTCEMEFRVMPCCSSETFCLLAVGAGLRMRARGWRWSSPFHTPARAKAPKLPWSSQKRTHRTGLARQACIHVSHSIHLPRNHVLAERMRKVRLSIISQSALHTHASSCSSSSEQIPSELILCLIRT